jgi:hypothetical protein
MPPRVVPLLLLISAGDDGGAVAVNGRFQQEAGQCVDQSMRR